MVWCSHISICEMGAVGRIDGTCENVKPNTCAVEKSSELEVIIAAVSISD